MNEFRFQTELRRRLDRVSIEVRRDPRWASEHGFHPEAFLCWDRDRVTEEPYVFFVCQRGGRPHEPCDSMIAMIARNSMNRVARGARGTYLQGVMERERKRVEADDHGIGDAFDTRWNGILDVPGRSQSMAGNSQMWSMDPTLKYARGREW